MKRDERASHARIMLIPLPANATQLAKGRLDGPYELTIERTLLVSESLSSVQEQARRLAERNRADIFQDEGGDNDVENRTLPPKKNRMLKLWLKDAHGHLCTAMEYGVLPFLSDHGNEGRKVPFSSQL